MNKIYRNLRFDLPMHFVLFLTNWMPDTTLCMRFRGFLATPFFKSCGRDLRLGRNLTFYNPSKISVGNSVYIAFGNWISAGEDILIDDEVLLGPYTIIVSSNHTRLNGSFRFGSPIFSPIVIGRGAWIGAHCSILAGAVVGLGCIIGANTVVRNQVPDHTLFAGNPGRVCKEFN